MKQLRVIFLAVALSCFAGISIYALSRISHAKPAVRGTVPMDLPFPFLAPTPAVTIQKTALGQFSVTTVDQTTPVRSLPLPAISAPSAAESSPPATSVETPEFRLFLSSEADAHSLTYTIKPGDTLGGIARRNGTSIELLKKINRLTGDTIRPGRTLKIPTRRLSVIIDKSTNTLLLKGDEEILKTYIVSTGSNNSTPVGVFKVTDKLENPTWYKAGAVVAPDSPQNVLGTRWLGINQPGYGIHGTTEPDKLGRQVTAGCVRMKNEDVEELYAIVPPGTPVTIVD